MQLSLVFIRIFFFLLTIFFMTTFMLSNGESSTLSNGLMGLGIGAIFSLFLIGSDLLFRKHKLRSFNIVVMGLFFGYLMGQALVIIFHALLDIGAASIAFKPQVVEMIEMGFFLFGIYLGTILTLRSSDEISMSIPFIKFSQASQKKKDLLIDASALSDQRVIDLASSGIIDHHLIIPRFVIKEMHALSETGDELSRNKAKRSLETLKKLEDLPELTLRYNETDFPEIQEPTNKLIRLARLLDANIISADLSRIQIPSMEGIRVINLNSLSNALKPLMQAGEIMKIKVQRYGKEPRQGVGYLEDGTMVVVNGGGDFIGDTIETQVLSVKHTASGRMIFCNAMEDEEYEPQPQFNHESYQK